MKNTSRFCCAINYSHFNQGIHCIDNFMNKMFFRMLSCICHLSGDNFDEGLCFSGVNLAATNTLIKNECFSVPINNAN